MAEHLSIDVLLANFGGFEADCYRGTIEGEFSRVLIAYRDLRAQAAPDKAEIARLEARVQSLLQQIGEYEAREGLVRTNDIISNDALRELFGLEDDDDDLDDGPHRVCAGEWHRENAYEWRFYSELEDFENKASAAAEALAARYRADVEKLKEALGPFGRWAADYQDEEDEDGFDTDFCLTTDRYAASESDLRNAARVLADTAPDAADGSGG